MSFRSIIYPYMCLLTSCGLLAATASAASASAVTTATAATITTAAAAAPTTTAAPTTNANPAPKSKSADSPSPSAPGWVFRGILAGDEVPVIFVALHKEMTLAYDERGGSILLVWKGKAVPDAGAGPQAGPQPAAGKELLPRYRAEGMVYHRRIVPQPWSVSGPKGTFKVTVTYEGASAHGDLAALNWSVRGAGGRRVRIREVPMFDDHYGDPGLFRNFTVSGLPKGGAVKLALAGRGLAETWGGGGNGGLQGQGEAVVMVQESDGETPLKVTWSAAADLPAPPSPGK